MVPEGAYPAEGNWVQILVSETRGTAWTKTKEDSWPATQEPKGPEQLVAPESADFSQLLANLKIPENKLLQAQPYIQKKIKGLLYTYQDIFSNSTPGCTDQVELNLELKPGTQLIRQRFIDLNPAMKEKLQAQIKTWLDEGVLERSKSPWSSHLVPVKKKDRSVRWAVDYSLLNRHLVMESYPFPGSSRLYHPCR